MRRVQLTSCRCPEVPLVDVVILEVFGSTIALLQSFCQVVFATLSSHLARGRWYVAGYIDHAAQIQLKLLNVDFTTNRESADTHIALLTVCESITIATQAIKSNRLVRRI